MLKLYENNKKYINFDLYNQNNYQFLNYMTPFGSNTVSLI
jgi:hypothetical protein